jgi:hypothetical protein
MLLKRNQGKLNFVLSYEMKSGKNRFSLAEADKEDTKTMVQGARLKRKVIVGQGAAGSLTNDMTLL